MKRCDMLIALFSLLLIASAIVSGAAWRIYQRFGALPAPEDVQKDPRWKNGAFRNEEPVVHLLRKSAAGNKFFRFLFSSENAPAHPVIPAVPEFPEHPSEFAVYWFGHSTLVWELGGARFLSDPVFGNAAPVSFAVRRMMKPPIPREKLPPLDFILISHDHYDHLEYDTICFFRNSTVKFITLPGVGARLRGWGIAPERIRELSWHQSITVSGVTVTAAPARHFSGRRLSDRDCTLWGSFVLRSGTRKLFFGADSGYGRHFREIGEKYGPFDCAFLEIDAWNEKWPNSHMFPAEFPLAVRDLRARAAVPVHWGVFDLAGHPWKNSIELVSAEMRRVGLTLFTPYPGRRWSGEPTPAWYNQQENFEK